MRGPQAFMYLRKAETVCTMKKAMRRRSPERFRVQYCARDGHLLECNHHERFYELMTHYLPHWPTLLDELNRLPLAYGGGIR